MKRTILSLVMAVAAIANMQAQEYLGQHLIFNKETGAKAHLELGEVEYIQPRIVDGKVEWNVVSYYEGDRFGMSVKGVTSIDFANAEEDAKRAREALVEFYNAMDGDHWFINTNWCSDKPINEWYGVNDGWKRVNCPYVVSLELPQNNLKGSFPQGDWIERLGCISALKMWYNDISGPMPTGLSDVLNFQDFALAGNKLTGTLPEDIFDLPGLMSFEVDGNEMTGTIPAGVTKLLDRTLYDIGFNENRFNNVSEAVLNHPKFQYKWRKIVPQKSAYAVPVIPAPALEATDMNGGKVLTTDLYKKNIYTLIYIFTGNRKEFADQLVTASKTYKGKGFGVLAMFVGSDSELQLKQYLIDNGVEWVCIDHQTYEQMIGSYYLYINEIHLVDHNGNIVFTSLMDENGIAENTGSTGSTRDQEVFNVLAERFGKVDFTPYASTDFSRDGEVMTLQKATVGKGFDIVFVGNGFVDKDMEPEGKYEKVMNDAMEQFFAYEPFTSLRSRFNVYAVKAVSKNDVFYDGTEHAINNNEDAFKYAQKVTGLIPDRPMRVNVIYNSFSAGRSITYMFDDKSYVAYNMEGVNRVINHECGGHGIGRLLDEYTEWELNNVSPTAETMQWMEDDYKKTGTGANIDFHSDVTQTKWAKFAANNLFAAEELGAYEGGAVYGKGVYRPTYNSMMFYNDTPFNAPSREAIYKTVMQESEGPGWEYDFDTFVTFDKKGRQQWIEIVNTESARAIDHVKVQQNISEILQSSPLPPVRVKGTWKDIMHKNTW